MKRLVLLLVLLAPALSVAQPVPVTWRPPTTCSTGQALVWNGSAWTCGSGGVSNSAGNNVIPKSDGTDLVASSWTDDGTTSTTTGALNVASTARIHSGLSGTDIADSLQVGNLVSSTTSADVGFSVGMNRQDGNVTNDTKLGASGVLLYRVGSGTSNGYTNTWANVDGSGNVTLPKNVGITGSLSVNTNKFTVDAATGNTVVAGTLDVGSDAFFGSANNIYFQANQINAGFDTDATSDLTLNAVGFQAGTTRSRNIVFGDGQSNTACTLTGSTKSLNCVGGLQVNGTSVLAGSGTDGRSLRQASGAIATGAFTDDGTNVAISGNVTLTENQQKWLKLGQYEASGYTTALIEAYSTGSSLALRTGSADRLTIANSGDATFANALSVLGSTTLGDDPALDTATINGAVTQDGSVILNNTTGTTRIGAGTDAADAANSTLIVENNGSTNIAVRNATNNVELLLDVSTVAGFVGTKTSHSLFLQAGGASFMSATTGGAVSMGDTGTSAVSSNLDVLTIGNTGTGQTGADKAELSITNSGSYNTTSASVSHYLANLVSTATESAGSNTFTNGGLRISVTNGDKVIGLRVEAGAAEFDDTANMLHALNFIGDDPAVSCGSGATVSGNNRTGVIHGGDGAGSGCAVTFDIDTPWSVAPVCVVSPVGASAHTTAPRISAVSSTSFTVIMDAGKDVNYHCFGSF